jgi:hypothetical protein
VVNDKPFGHHVMKGVALRKGKSFTDIARLMLAQCTIPTLHVRNLSTLFTNRMMCFLWKDFLVGIPEIAVRNTTAVRQWHFVPQTATSRFTAVANDKGDDLSGSTAHDRPQPAFIELFEYKTPGFVIFQNITWFRWQQSVFEFGQLFDMLNNLSGNTLSSNIKNPFQASQTYALLVGAENDRLLRFFISRFDTSTRCAPQSLQ